MEPESAWRPISVLASDARYQIEHFDAMTKALETVLKHEAWRRFRRPDKQIIQEYGPDEFALFLTTPPTAGCGLEIAALLAVLRSRHRDDLVGRVLDMTAGQPDQAGGDRRSEQFQSSDTTLKLDRDSSYVLGRLKRDRPDLAAEVASGTLSANAAAIEAGIRHRYLRVRSDDAGRAVAVLLDYYSRDQLRAALDDTEQ